MVEPERRLTLGGMGPGWRAQLTKDPNGGRFVPTPNSPSAWPVINSDALCDLAWEMTVRTRHSLSASLVCNGSISQMSKPGTLVATGLYSPRNSAGASGLRSY